MITPGEFKNDVLMLAREMGVVPIQIHIQSMKHKWASCSSKGRLTFDKSLLSEPKEVRFKVIIHELLHLKYPNHGKMFNLLLKLHLSKSLHKEIDTDTNSSITESNSDLIKEDMLK